MSDRLMATKLHTPQQRQALVERPELLQRLQDGLDSGRRLSLISASAGFGKTTLAVAWLSRLPRVTWISLDEGDNDPARFFNYLATAFQKFEPGVGQGVTSLLDMPSLPPAEALATELVNDLAAIETPLILCLDDYHVIRNVYLHQAMQTLVEYLPAQVHLVITTRQDPALPLPRMRARGQLTEIRGRDLKFSRQEIESFYELVMKINLPAEAASVLETRTEGWIAGLKLAGLAMQFQPASAGSDFIAAFGGSHRYVIDYLVDEVLTRLDERTRLFLMRTSVLNRFSADLCQAVTGMEDSRAILDELERQNLFLIALDDEREWFRYHHLFADVLQAGLSHADAQDAHILAAAWFEQQDMLPDAVEHWVAAGKSQEAGRLIARAADALLRMGELHTLLGWLEKLPDDQSVQQPELFIYKIMALLFTGKVMNAVELITRLESGRGMRLPASQRGRLLAMKAWMAMASGRVEAYELSKQALANLAESDLSFRAMAMIVYATECQRHENMQASIDAFREAYRISMQAGQDFAAMTSLANLAFKLYEQGKLHEAEALCLDVVQRYSDARGRPLPVIGIIFVALGTITYEKGDLTSAEFYARQGTEICQRLFSRAMLGGDGELILSQIAFERGQVQEALEIIHSTWHNAERAGVAYVPVKMALQEIGFYIWMGDAKAAEEHLLALEELARTKFPNVADGALRVRARLLILQERASEALPILNDLEEHARASECDRRLIIILIIKALAYAQLGEHEQMRTDLSKAVRLAAPEGYRQIFVREGSPLVRLLEQVRGAAAHFVDEILATILAQEKPVLASAPRSAEELIEPLSEQEAVILGLLGEGCSNQEIGSRLFISAGTAKWHVHNLLAKLGAKNRTEAVHRGRELGLLPK